MSTGTKYPEIFAALAAPLPTEAIREKKKSGKDGGEAWLRYTTARAVMNRFDDVVGPEGWTDDYVQMPDGEMMCRITITLPDGATVTKSDVGIGQGPNNDIKRKAIYSDALKRAAVKFGVGRHLYRDGMPVYVRKSLGLDESGRKIKPADTPPADRKATRTDHANGNGHAQPPPSMPETSLDSRSAVNSAFPADRGQGKGQDEEGDEPYRDPRSKETTTLWGDRIGTRGLDVRKWADIQDGCVEAVGCRLNRYRVDELGLTPLVDDKMLNVFAFLNHMVRVTVEANAPDPNPNTPDENGKRKAIGNGKKAEHLHSLYLTPQWREWMRAEARDYLGGKLSEAKAVAWSEFSGEPVTAEGEPAEAAANGQAGEWAPGRE